MWMSKAKQIMQKLSTDIAGGEMPASDELRCAVEQHARFLEMAYNLSLKSDTYAPLAKQYLSEPPYIKEHHVSWNDMQTSIAAMRRHDVPELSKLAQYMEEALRFSSHSLRIFPAVTKEQITDKYNGFHLDFEGLFGHNEENMDSPYDSHVIFSEEEGNIVHLNLLWTNMEQYMHGAPFTITLADVRFSRQYGYGAADSFGSFVSMECFETHDDEFLYSEDEEDKESTFNGELISKIEDKVAVPVGEQHIMHLDYLLSLFARPMVPNTVEWVYDESNIPGHTISVSPTVDREMEYYCCRPDFTVNCEAVPHCCGECPMLKHIYYSILPKALTKESMENLRKVVEPTGLFQHADGAGQSICFDGCKKDGSCSQNVRTAVNELYRYYYEVRRTMGPLPC